MSCCHRRCHCNPCCSRRVIVRRRAPRPGINGILFLVLLLFLIRRNFGVGNVNTNVINVNGEPTDIEDIEEIENCCTCGCKC